MCDALGVEAKQELNPAQQEVLAERGAPKEQRPRFDAMLRHELQRALEDGLEPMLPMLDLREGEKPGDSMFVSKYALGQVLGCERKFVFEQAEPFEWKVPIARGTIAHKAIELSVHWRRELDPMTLVDEAMARRGEGIDPLADWLQTISETERAELRGTTNALVLKFLECFPPLKPAWYPSTETSLRVEIHDRFVLSGRCDLSIGVADGDRAGKVLVDLKTGSTSIHHRDDLRFYALLDAIRIGTPPRRLATYYLDQGRFQIEDVTEDLLFSTVARVVDGIERMLMLSSGQRDATTATGPACRWCPVRHDCDDGKRHLADDEDTTLGAGW